MRPMKLHAGAARVDITPELGIQLAGDIGRYRPTEEIRDRLYANALVVEWKQDEESRHGSRSHINARICLLSLDLLSVNTEWADRIRQEAGEILGIGKEAVALHVVQNHASPVIGHFFIKDECPLMPPEYPWLRGGDDRYNEVAVRNCLAAVKQARDNLEPVTLAVGHGIDGRVAFNRRFVMRDGSAECHPANCDPNIAYVEGPTDPEVGVATLTNEHGKVISVLLHHTCHPCNGYPHRYVIGDWPGAWAELMRQKFGGACVPLVINGCCGNIHHNNHLVRGYVSDYHQMAARLTETSEAVLEKMALSESSIVASGQTVLTLPLRKLTDEIVAAARALVDEHPEPVWLDEDKTCVHWDWVYAVTRLDLKDTQDKNPNCDYEIQAFRIGDLALATVMGEPFVQAQLEIKLASTAAQTMVAHFCNGYAGYIPTAEALQRGGYETRTGSGSKFQPDALEQITKASISLLAELFKE